MSDATRLPADQQMAAMASISAEGLPQAIERQAAAGKLAAGCSFARLGRVVGLWGSFGAVVHECAADWWWSVCAGFLPCGCVQLSLAVLFLCSWHEQVVGISCSGPERNSMSQNLTLWQHQIVDLQSMRML